MNFYAASNMPVYRVEREARQKASKQGPKKSRILGLPSSPKETVPSPVRPLTSSHAVPHDAGSIDRLLDPAIDGPPSPESIRELSQQVRRASIQDKHHSHQTSSSGSSSLRSLTPADHPTPWEFEPGPLSRKSSGRSTSSSMPSRERPDSVQIFGKSIFSRRAKMRRESGAQSSSSSMYSTDAVADAPLPPPQPLAPNRESTIPALFGLRRGSKQEQAAETQRRLNISGPYNFQHVAHTQKDHVPPDLQRANHAVGHTPGMHLAAFSSESLAMSEEDTMTPLPELQQTTSLTRAPSVIQKTSTSRRVLNRSQSQEQLSRGMPPPRPPRSPIDQSAPCPPIPPPRGSSRTSVRHERFDSADRPPTSISFRTPQYADPGSPVAASYGYAPAPDMKVIPEHAFHSITGQSVDANWPLPCPSSATASECTLPGVPEEDETAVTTRKTHASAGSKSSLRGSQSVPMLRALSIRRNDDPARRTSDASDTLGRFDLVAAQRDLQKALAESSRGEAIPREAWEDDIDYCYEHEAEADCDYEWGRPSLETSRDGDTATPVDDQGRGIGSYEEASSAMLTPGQFDVPDLSPVSQLSSATAQEAITPTVVNNPKASNFSLPRVDSNKNLLHVRKPSDASSFKESQGFTLSPSLLIPPDYQQQMMACEAERQDASDFAFRHSDEPALNMDPSALLLRYRTSASTTGTIESTSSAFDKHISTASTSTDYTRLTASTSSLDMETCFPTSEPLQRFPSFDHGIAESKTAMPPLPETEEVAQPPVRRPDFKSRGSESNLGRLAMDEPWPGKAKMPIQAQRGRSRTTSLSTPPPPNQYALFPSVHLSGKKI